MDILASHSGFVFADSPTEKGFEERIRSYLGLDFPTDWRAASWQQQLKWAIREKDLLIRLLELQDSFSDSQGDRVQATSAFPVFVPLPLLARMRVGDPHDPLLRQVLPTMDEDLSVPGYSQDPLGEAVATRSPGLLHKYQGRALLVTTGVCAVNCRYCFRRDFPYGEIAEAVVREGGSIQEEAKQRLPRRWEKAIDEIAGDSTIDEVILSGGDPLTLVDKTLNDLIDSIDRVSHVKRLRIHTRLPVVIPQRVTESLLSVLVGRRLQMMMVIHSNHAQELDAGVQQSLGGLARCGILLLNQSVLLDGVNDSLETLVNLSERLLECRVMPYYLHKNDPITGTSHFEVSVPRGVELVKQMRARLPGYAVPRFVQEIAGQPGKTVLA